jgi:hypothetical protein
MVIAWTYLSYAVEVLNEMTRPSTVPSTVSRLLAMPKSVLVFSDTRTTTATWQRRHQ